MAPKFLIRLTDAAPVSIDPDGWPVIASGAAGWSLDTDAMVEIIVRQHADGRLIVNGFLSYRDDTGSLREYTAGRLHDSPISLYGNEIASAIEFVTSRMAVPPAHVNLVGRNPAREAQYNCVNNLPPIDL